LLLAKDEHNGTAIVFISPQTREMRKLLQVGLMSTLLLGTFGCAANSSEKAAADARVQAADARVDAADATARVNAADAHVRAADARVKAADAGVEAAEADARVNSTQTPATSAYPPAKARLVIPSGTLLKVSLIDALSSDGNSPGDHFMASLAESVVVDGTTVLEKSTQLRGRVVAVEGSGRVKGLASIQLALTDIMQGDRIVAITTNRFVATAAASKTRDGEIIAGGAGLGAVIGAIAGGGKGAAIGAVTGGGAGTGVVLATKGKEIHYGPETRLSFTLTNSVQM
jgi:uncharacterized OsmC-like protein